MDKARIDEVVGSNISCAYDQQDEYESLEKSIGCYITNIFDSLNDEKIKFRNTALHFYIIESINASVKKHNQLG